MKNKKKVRVVSALLAATMVLGLAMGNSSTVNASQDKVTNIDGFQAKLIADPNTSTSENIFNGSPSEDGKIWTDKSVTTGSMYGATAGEENFNVALSAMAQTYSTVTTSLETTEYKVAYDVVFVLDFSRSMNFGLDEDDNKHESNINRSRAGALLNALNPAIDTLMENENNRIGVIGYSGSSASDKATNLLSLDYYSLPEEETEYFESSRVRDGNYQVFRATVNPDLKRGVDNPAPVGNIYKNFYGGTNTQQGIYAGMKMLNDTAKPDDDVIRMPIMVLLTDGDASYAYKDYKTLSGGWNNTASGDAQIGAYTILSAAYAKDMVNQTYKDRYDYTDIIEGYADDSMIAKYYTIGLAINNTSWTHFVMDPSTKDTDNNSTVTGRNGIKTYLNEDNDYRDNYQYADKYFGGSMSEDDLKDAFEDILSDMEVDPEITTSVNNPVGSESGGGAAGSFVTFTDYLGYKMELKGEKQYLRYGGVNYEFTRQDDGNYTFSGRTQDGTENAGPQITEDGKTYSLNDVIFRADYEADKTVNNQTGYWKVTWQFPSALLPMYSRADQYKDVRPIRMLYEIGLMDEDSEYGAADLARDGLKINANGGLLDADAKDFHDYAFYTNLYNFADSKAEAKVDFTPTLDNPYYYKTGYTTEEQTESAKYLRLDVTSRKDQTETVTGTADVTLSNVKLNSGNFAPSNVTFTYKNRNYTVDLSGSWNSAYTGDATIKVTTDELDDGTTITGEIPVEVTATRSNNWQYVISAITIGGEQAAYNSSRGTASVTGLEISEERPIETTGEEVISVYMELKEDADGLYVTDLTGKRIAVEKEGDDYKIVIGKDTYYSNVYYKYPEGTKQYVDKELPKGEITKSYVGHFEMKQPVDGEKLTEDNFSEFFQYYSSDNTTVTPATGILFSDGSTLGTVTETSNRPAEGTFRVIVDGIKNSNETDSGNINFDFTVEEIKTESGVRYSVVDCKYWEPEDTKLQSVDIYMSDIPEVIEDGTKYSYDVSYTIRTTNPDDVENADNKTHTDEKYFTSTLSDGSLDAAFGNNGRISVQIDGETYENNVAVQKQWVDEDGEVIDINDPALDDLEVEASLYQHYTYINKDGEEVSVGVGDHIGAFTTVTLNRDNNFSYTWAANSLPKYLVDAGGNYVEDQKGEKVTVTYYASETHRQEGWSYIGVTQTGPEDGTVTFTLENTPEFKLSPSVEKVWTKDGETMDAPDGYKVKMQLLANGQLVKDGAQFETQPVTATLTQAEEDSEAQLTVTYRGKTFIDEIIQADDIANGGTKVFSKTLDMILGTEGTGNYADQVKISVTVADTYGGRFGISGATATYYANGSETATLSPAKVERTESDDQKKVEFTMAYIYERNAEVILDGETDENETKPWNYTWAADEWHLPSVVKDPDTGEYEAVTYSVKETLLVPDESGTVEIEGQKYAEYSADDNTGLITIQEADGSTTVYKSTSSLDTGDDTDYQFTITNDLSEKTVTAKKVWVDNDNAYHTRPDSLTFTLTADGTTVAESEKNFARGTGEFDGTETITWTDLPVYNAGGEKIAYLVSETMTPEGTAAAGNIYATTVETDADDENHFIVTNRLDVKANLTSMSVVKNWIDDGDAEGKRPDNLYMVLYRQIGEDGAPEYVFGKYPITLNDDTLNGSWTDLPMYNHSGEKYIYSVKEYEQLGARPEEWKEGVEGYEASVEAEETSYVFTNQLEAGSVDKTVTKVWKDAALEDERPEDVTVVLRGKTTNGDLVDLSLYSPKQTLNEEGGWSYTWTNLPEYEDGGKIDYTVTETKVGSIDVVNNTAGNYTVSVTDDGTGNQFAVTNTLSDATTVSVTKVWEDTPEDYDIPDVDFDVKENGNGTLVTTLTVTKDAPTAISQELPKYDSNGDLIEYIVEEQEVQILEDADYTIDSVISENTAKDGTFAYTATNTYRMLTQDITGIKTWAGVTGTNIPENITVELSRSVDGEDPKVVNGDDGTALQPVWTDNGDNTWTYTYEDLPIYEDSNDAATKYTYSIQETKVGDIEVTDGKAGDYTVTVDGMNITNTLGGTVDGADLSGTKTWVDVEEENIPDSIVVRLMRSIAGGTPEQAVDTDGAAVADITVTKEGQDDAAEWSYDFKGVTLPKYDEDGNAYTYTVQEVSVTADGTTAEVDRSGTETVVGDYVVTEDGLAITNRLKDGEDKDLTVTYPITKTWEDVTEENLPDSITVQLMKDGSDEGAAEELTKANATEGNAMEWSYTYTGLRRYSDNGITPYEYTAKETKIESTDVEEVTQPDGSSALKAGDFFVTYTQQDAKGTRIHNRLATPDVDQEETTFDVSKKWLDQDGNDLTEQIPDSITIQVYRDGAAYQEYTFTQDDADAGWTHTFKKLPKYQADGLTESEYHIEETKIIAGDSEYTVENGMAGAYVVTVNDDGNEITNQLSGDAQVTETSVTGIKTWTNQEGDTLAVHPDSITVQLLQDGKPMEDQIQTVGEAQNWTYTFEHLPKYQANGVIEHVYTVQETLIGDTPVGESEYDSTTEGMNILNKLKDIRISYSGEKLWRDGDNADQTRPDSVEIELLADGTPIGQTQTVSADAQGRWSYTFVNLPKYDSTGKEIVYSVQENKVDEDYGVTYEGSNIINTLKAGSRDIVVTKHWEDDTNAEGYRPDSITYTVNGTPYTMTAEEHMLNENTWQMTIARLPRYDENGNKIIYNLPIESPVEKYTTSGFTGDMDSGFEITNTLALGEEDLTQYTVQKIWVDNSNAYATRPETLTVQLLQDGKEYDTILLSESNQWTYTFQNLPIKRGDTEENHVYTAVEEELGAESGYAQETTPGEGSTTFTNTLTGTQQITVEKVWKNVSEEYRPDNVTIELQQNGTTIKTVTLSADDNWMYDFGTCDMYDGQGVKYVYSVVETEVGGVPVAETDYLEPEYNTPQLTDGKLAFAVTNTLDTDKTDSIAGIKTWVDNDDQYKLRPKSIIVNLLQGEKVVKSVKVTASEDGQWKYEFTDLPRYDKDTGEPLIYTIEEAAVENYITTVNGWDLTNVLDESKIPEEPKDPEEPKKPEKPTNQKTVKTGDQTPLGGYLLLMAGAAAVIISGSVMSRRKRDNE